MSTATTSTSDSRSHNATEDLRLGLTANMVNQASYNNAVTRFAERKIKLPTFTQLANPQLTPQDALSGLATVDPDTPDPANLWRVNWYNDAARVGRVEVPEHVILPSELTGVDATIVVVLGNKFPMIRAHKVLAAYACLAPRVVTGQFDPTTQRAIWPSTGNYARGGVAISRMLSARGTAVLPEGMSKERFDWLSKWTEDPSDIIRTYGTESNVKEIYDACNELQKDPQNVILNQFSEFANYVGHYTVTGDALAHVYDHVAAHMPATSHPKLRAFTSATGSAGTIAAGDKLKERYGSQIVACEALECPTMLENGFGEHNIQGIGDKHIPLIHNVMNTDAISAVSDQATDHLDLLFTTPAGRTHLVERMGVPQAIVDQLVHFGFSAICNTLSAIKYAKWNHLGADDVIITVATDGHELYISEAEHLLATKYPNGFTAVDAADVAARYLGSVDTDHFLELSHRDKNRIFNLGYYTWVEQQGVSVADFEARRQQSFWQGVASLREPWDQAIIEFNQRTGMN
jgi:cysteine synthase